MKDLVETPRQHAPRYIAGEEEEGPILSGVTFTLLSAAALVGLMAAAVFFGSNQVEAAVRADTLEFLRRAGYNGVQVTAEGQDVLLTGTVATEDELVTIPEAVALMSGVGEVQNSLSVKVVEAPPDVPVPSDPMVITLADDVLDVSGTMPDQPAIDRVTAALEETGHRLDTDDLVVREGVPPVEEWMAAVLGITERLDREVDAYEIVVNPDSGVATVSAVFDSRQTRSDVFRQAEDLFEDSPLAFVSALTMVDAPPPPPRQEVVELQEDLDDLISGKVVEFELNSDVLTRSGRELLFEILSALRDFPDVPVEIAGHADATGTPAANMDLSRRRAQAVVDYLVARAARIATVSW